MNKKSYLAENPELSIKIEQIVDAMSLLEKDIAYIQDELVRMSAEHSKDELARVFDSILEQADLTLEYYLKGFDLYRAFLHEVHLMNHFVAREKDLRKFP